ncbi:MAG: protein kinase [Candidatus Obscuribacterales bacterium]|nr:protein kinase [Candidatus Obscuribacterales bacterium]
MERTEVQEANATTNNAQDPAGFEIGSIVFDKYRIEDFISSGAKGRVYRVRDTVLDNVVALKILAADSDLQKDLVRFQSEARMASKLNHSNIATVLDFGLYNSTPYLAMEYVEGKTLRSLLDAATTLDLGDFCEIFSQVCYALDYAHMHGIVHRDIKPANIVISDRKSGDGLHVKILDFGVAKRVDNIACMDGRITPSGRIVGSPCYMSPEQSRGQQVTQKSDNYSLGCVMWECLTGEPPFVGDSVMETLLLQQNASPGSLEERARVEIPADLNQIIQGLLSKSPDDRPGLKSKVIPLLEQHFARVNASNVDEPVNEVVIPTVKYWTIPRWWILTGALIGFSFVAVFLTQIGIRMWFPNNTIHLENMQEAANDTFGFAKNERQQRIQEIQNNRGVIKFDCLSTDEDVQCLTGRKSITLLDVSQSDVTNKTVEIATTMPNLQSFHVNWTHIDCLDGLEKLPKLRCFEAKGHNLNDDSIRPLAGTKLLILDLGNSEITDRAFKTIGTIKTLRTLGLKSVENVQFESLEPLRGLKRLTTIDLTKNKITPDTVRKLKSLCPGLTTILVAGCPNISTIALKKLEEEFPEVVFNGATSLVSGYAVKIQQATEKHYFREALRLQIELTKILESRNVDPIRLFSLYMSNANLSIHSGSLPEARYWHGRARQGAARTGDPRHDIQVIELGNNIELLAVHGKLNRDLMNRFVRTFKRAEQVYKDDHFELSLRLRILADTLKSNGYRAEAWYYYNRALDYFKDWKTDAKNNEYLLLGTVYVHMAEYLREEKSFAKSIPYFESGLKILETFGPRYMGNAVVVANGYAGYAICELCLNEPQRALRLSSKAVGLVEKLGLVGACKKYVYYDHALILIALVRAKG